MDETGRLGALLIAHAEDAAEIDATPHAAGTTPASSPPARRAPSESAIERLIAPAALTGARAHVVHLSAAEALPAIRTARAAGVRAHASRPARTTSRSPPRRCPTAHTEFKCCPPIRDAANRDLLWEALADGTIDAVVSDHSPCVPELKRFDTGDFGEAWGGIASLQLGLPAVWTEARRAATTWPTWSAGWPTAPARLVGLDRKGRIEPSARTPTCARSPRTRRSWSTPPGSGTRTPCRRTPGVRSPARSGGPGCAGRRWTRPDRRGVGC